MPARGQPAIMWSDTKLLHNRSAAVTKKGKSFTQSGKPLNAERLKLNAKYNFNKPQSLHSHFALCVLH
jgi:hypothetical protein